MTGATVTAARPAAVRSSWPAFVVWLVVASAAWVAAQPSVAPKLELDRSEPWQLWRWVTCHFTHFGGEHLFWSGAVCLGLVLWLGVTRRVVAVLAGAIVSIPAAVLALQPEIAIYRGLSGLDSALFVLVVADVVTATRDRRVRALAVLAGLLFVAKLGYELALQQTVFVRGDAFVPVPLAHFVGAGVGLLAAARAALSGRAASSMRDRTARRSAACCPSGRRS